MLPMFKPFKPYLKKITIELVYSEFNTDFDNCAGANPFRRRQPHYLHLCPGTIPITVNAKTPSNFSQSFCVISLTLKTCQPIKIYSPPNTDWHSFPYNYDVKKAADLTHKKSQAGENRTLL